MARGLLVNIGSRSDNLRHQLPDSPDRKVEDTMMLTRIKCGGGGELSCRRMHWLVDRYYSTTRRILNIPHLIEICHSLARRWILRGRGLRLPRGSFALEDSEGSHLGPWQVSSFVVERFLKWLGISLNFVGDIWYPRTFTASFRKS